MGCQKDLKQYITAPMRWREQSLAIAQEFGRFFDEVATALQAGVRRDDLVEEIAGLKPLLLETLTEAAEYEYQSELRKRALRLLERHPGLTAEEALTTIEADMLETAVVPS